MFLVWKAIVRRMSLAYAASDRFILVILQIAFVVFINDNSQLNDKPVLKLSSQWFSWLFLVHIGIDNIICSVISTGFFLNVNKTITILLAH